MRCHSYVPIIYVLDYLLTMLVTMLCYCSSQMLFYICKKLTSHQMLSSTEILKWLREILICRNKFLLKNKVSKIPSLKREEYVGL